MQEIQFSEWLSGQMNVHVQYEQIKMDACRV
jgi:hypothetical protein